VRRADEQHCPVCGLAFTHASEERAATDNVCARCLDLAAVRTAFKDALASAIALAAKDPDAALQLLTDVLSGNQERDHDGWLYRSVHTERAEILSASHRHSDALAELRAVDLRTVAGSDDYARNKQSVAVVLARAARPQEAIAELELALAARQGLHHELVGGLLLTYAEIAGQAGVEVPRVYADEVERAVLGWGVPLDHAIFSRSLRDALVQAHSATVDAQKRYNSLRRSARGKPIEMVITMISEYIESEPVERYRVRAKHFLESLTPQPEIKK
jgi:hypothetical protein